MTRHAGLTVVQAARIIVALPFAVVAVLLMFLAVWIADGAKEAWRILR